MCSSDLNENEMRKEQKKNLPVAQETSLTSLGPFFRSVYLLPLVSPRLSFISPSRRGSLLVPFGPLLPYPPFVVVPVPTPRAVLAAVVLGVRLVPVWGLCRPSSWFWHGGVVVP